MVLYQWVTPSCPIARLDGIARWESLSIYRPEPSSKWLLFSCASSQVMAY